MIFIDWIIVFSVLGGMIFSVNLSKGLMKSVTDFLSAGRTAGRYLIAVSSGIAGLGAISIVMFLEMGYVAGFSLAWWGLSQGIIILMLTMSGWVIYRFRSTRSALASRNCFNTLWLGGIRNMELRISYYQKRWESLGTIKF